MIELANDDREAEVDAFLVLGRVEQPFDVVAHEDERAVDFVVVELEGV